MAGIRIGHGYDVHRFAEGRKLILAGITIPHEKGLLGHSDADVLAHAVMDALLGALSMGDIGTHFPDSDVAYWGADSMQLLAVCYKMIQTRGYQLGNLDATILAQAPKLAGFIPYMRENFARVLEVSVDAISIKATTEEGLGFTGSGEGMASHCVCLLEQKLA